MSALLMRILIAVVGVLLVFALLGPVSRILGLSVSGDVETVLRVCIGGIALFYILSGPSMPWTSGS